MTNPKYGRMERVNSIIKHVVADVVEDLKDPRLGLVTITGVQTHPNLRDATIYFSTLDLADTEATLAALQSAAPRLRKVLGSKVRLKYTPALHFEVDSGVVSGSRIDSLLRQLAAGGEEE
jgi:ribosome-binding factor A